MAITRDAWSSSRYLAFAFAIAAGLAGCKGNEKTYTVEGRVVFEDDKPAVELAGGTVELESLDHKVSAKGTILPGGSFRLTTYTEDDGAVAGQHRALVAPPLNAKDVETGKPKIMDTRFQSFDRSGLNVTIKPEANQPLVLKVQRAKRKP